MTTAYVLITCEAGTDESVKNEIQGIKLKEARGLYGVYDIIAKVEADDIQQIKKNVVEKIKKISNVRTAATLVGSGTS